METGLLGGVKWEIEGNTLIFSPKQGNKGTFHGVKSDFDFLQKYHHRVEHIKTKGVLHYKGNILKNMFGEYTNLKTADLSAFETSKAISMNSMFQDCPSLEAVNLSSFNTENIKDMEDMFWGCKKLKSLDLSNFDTTSVTDMQGMFCKCPSLKTLNLSSFDTSNVNNMDSMFHECESLKTLDLSSFDTSNVINMRGMFSGCFNLEKINFSHLTINPSLCTDFTLCGCDSLKEVTIPDDLEKRYKTLAPLTLCGIYGPFLHNNNLFSNLLSRLENLTGLDFTEEKKLLSVFNPCDCNEIAEWKARHNTKVNKKLSEIIEIIGLNNIEWTRSEFDAFVQKLGMNGVMSDINAYLNGVPMEDILA